MAASPDACEWVDAVLILLVALSSLAGLPFSLPDLSSSLLSPLYPYHFLGRP
jgi:hypothetical protein